jgi:hypothetical protein
VTVSKVMSKSPLWASILLLTCVPLLRPQNPQLQMKYARRFPTVVFTSVRWNANPSYYSIAIDATGTATYQAAPNSLEESGVPFTTEFQVSDKTRRIVFNLAQRLNFFAEGYGESASSPDKTDVRTLSYLYENVNNQFTYTITSDPDIEEITSIFEELSATFEDGRKLLDMEAKDKQAIAAELQAMQKKADRHALRDIYGLVPILREIASDGSLDRNTRTQAETLLTLARNSH